MRLVCKVFRQADVVVGWLQQINYKQKEGKREKSLVCLPFLYFCCVSTGDQGASTTGNRTHGTHRVIPR